MQITTCNTFVKYVFCEFKIISDLTMLKQSSDYLQFKKNNYRLLQTT